MEKRQKGMMIALTGMLLVFIQFTMIIFPQHRATFESMMTSFVFHIFIFCFGIISVCIVLTGLSLGFVEMHEETRRKKLMIIYILAAILITVFIIIIRFIENIENKLAYILTGVFVISSILILTYDIIREKMAEVRQNRESD